MRLVDSISVIVEVLVWQYVSIDVWYLGDTIQMVLAVIIGDRLELHELLVLM